MDKSLEREREREREGDRETERDRERERDVRPCNDFSVRAKKILA